MLEMRSATNGIPDHVAICLAISSLASFDSAYVVIVAKGS
jgi:hypothetical protein